MTKGSVERRLRDADRWGGRGRIGTIRYVREKEKAVSAVNFGASQANEWGVCRVCFPSPFFFYERIQYFSAYNSLKLTERVSLNTWLVMYPVLHN